jgi:hypothetical protein
MAMTGSQFLKQIKDVRNPVLSQLALKQMLDGNMPDFNSGTRMIDCTTEAVIDGLHYVCTYRVKPQYLSIGVDDDFIQWPLTFIDLQAFCDAHILTSESDGSKVQQWFIPSKKIVKNTWLWTTRKGCAIEAIPMGPSDDMTWPVKIDLQQQKINAAMKAKGCPITAFSRAKKAYITAPNMVGTGGPMNNGYLHFTGWYKLDGFGWQDQGYKPVDATGGHEASYADYSHGCDLVYYNCDVNGTPYTYDELCNHPVLWPLVSDQGPFNPRFPNTGSGAKEVMNKTDRMPRGEAPPASYKGPTFATTAGVVKMSAGADPTTEKVVDVAPYAGDVAEGGSSKLPLILGGAGLAALGYFLWKNREQGPAY